MFWESKMFDKRISCMSPDQTFRHQTHFNFFQKATNTTKEHSNKISWMATFFSNLQSLSVLMYILNFWVCRKNADSITYIQYKSGIQAKSQRKRERGMKKRCYSSTLGLKSCFLLLLLWVQVLKFYTLHNLLAMHVWPVSLTLFRRELLHLARQPNNKMIMWLQAQKSAKKPF